MTETSHLLLMQESSKTGRDRFSCCSGFAAAFSVKPQDPVDLTVWYHHARLGFLVTPYILLQNYVA